MQIAICYNPERYNEVVFETGGLAEYLCSEQDYRTYYQYTSDLFYLLYTLILFSLYYGMMFTMK